MHRPTLWLIGDFTSAEFTFALAGLSFEVQVRRFASVAEAVAASDRQHEPPIAGPELLILAQTHPGEVRTSEVERLHVAHPLARILLLLGAWCEGEMRTGFPIAGTTRIFWHAFPVQVDRLLNELRSGRSAPGAFPRIAGQQERLLQQIPADRSNRRPLSSGPIVLIRATHITTFETLADCLRPSGYRCFWLHPQQVVRFPEADLLLFEAPQLDEAEWELLAATRAALPSVATVLLAGFPRYDDLARANTLGVSALLAKPYLVADLLATAQAALPSQQHQSGLEASQRAV